MPLNPSTGDNKIGCHVEKDPVDNNGELEPSAVTNDSASCGAESDSGWRLNRPMRNSI